MSTYYRHLIESGLLLDQYPNAAVAYSLRKLRAGYIGSAIRVRRSSDNAEQNIGFIGNDLDTASMLDFVGYNLWTYSEDISNALYIKGGLNTTGTPPYIDQATAPDGTLTGDKLIESTANGQHVISRSTVVLLNGVSYNFSVFVKQAERTKIYVGTNISGSSVFCNIDLTNGTISNNGLSNTPIVTAEANGWYRVSFNLIGLGSSAGVSVGLLNASDQRIYVGNNTSGAYVWGFQISQSSTVKLYQKTVATAAGNGFVYIWYDQSGNSRNAEQATPAHQAQIVSNGFVIIDAVTLKPTTTWSSDRYTIIGGVNPITRYLSIGVLNRTANSNVIAHIGVAGAIGGTNGQQTFLWSPTTGNVRSDMSSVVNHGTNTNTGSFITTSEKNASDLKTIYLNEIALPITATQAPSLTGINMNTFGQAGNNFTTCQYQEYIYWNSEQSANRVAIETLINDYYAIY
jgi:hypothetical protein